MDISMVNNTSAELREWAARCEDGAAATSDENERASLLRKCEALRALADQEDWLAGQPVDACASRANGAVFPASNRQQAAE
jgi:hypothetical protein